MYDNIKKVFREASMSVSLCGGYQVVNGMSPQGEIRLYDIERLKKLSEFLNNKAEYYCDDFGNAMNEIPPIYDLTVAVKCDKKPESVMLEPDGEVAEFTYDGKYAHINLKKLHIHTAIVIR